MDRLREKRRQVLAALHELNRIYQLSGLRVEQIMTAAPSCIAPETNVLELVRLLKDREFRHLLVTESDGRLVGVISDRDVVRCFGPGEFPDPSMLARIPASEIMSTDLVTVGPKTLLERAVHLLIAHGISSLPVIADEHLVGIVTNTDLFIVLQTLLQGWGPAATTFAESAAACDP